MSLRSKDSKLEATSNDKYLAMSNAASAENLVIEKQPQQPIRNPPVKLLSFNSKASSQAPRGPKYHTTQQERAYNFGLAMLRLVTTEQESILREDSGDERRISARRTRYDLRIAQWLLSRGFSWQSFGVYGSWQHSFRTFRYIPESSLIVDLCIEGDLANVQKVFEKGLASPFDRVAYQYGDFSLLHVSLTTLPV